MANPHESELHYPFGDTLPAPGGIARGRARRALGAHGAAVRARPHQPVAAARPATGRRLDHRRLRHHQRRDRAAWEQVFANELEGLPVLRVIVTHMHPDHIGLAHWLTERWHDAAGCGSAPPTTTRARLASQQHHRLRRRARGGVLRQPRPDRPRGAGQGARRAATTTPAWCRRCPAQFRRLLDGRRCAHRRPRLALHRRLRPCARAHGAALRGARRADLRRHGAAAHLDQRQRLSTSSPRPTRCRCTSTRSTRCARCRPTRWCCRRTAGRSAGCTRASTSCATPRRAPRRRDGGLRAQRRSARPTC